MKKLAYFCILCMLLSLFCIGLIGCNLDDATDNTIKNPEIIEGNNETDEGTTDNTIKNPEIIEGNNETDDDENNKSDDPSDISGIYYAYEYDYSKKENDLNKEAFIKINSDGTAQEVFQMLEFDEENNYDYVQKVYNYTYTLNDHQIKFYVENTWLSIGGVRDGALYISQTNDAFNIFHPSRHFYKNKSSIVTEYDGIRYHVGADGNYSVTGFTDSKQNINIRSNINGTPVTSILYTATYDEITTVTIPDSVTSIGEWAFSYCKNLTDITIPRNLTSLGDCAFFDCTNLKKIELPASLVDIGRNAFEGCSNLESIIVSPDNPVYHSNNNCLIETAAKTLLAGCNNSKIPADGSVTIIGENAFNGRTSLTEIIIPDSVKIIQERAFLNCSSLTKISMNCVTEIGSYAFFGCNSLTVFTIPQGVTLIDYNTFYLCSNLSKITIPVSVSRFRSIVFTSCINLKDIYYEGTIKQWNLIDKDTGTMYPWDYDTGEYTIHCTDGDILKDGTIIKSK
ncbi:MAG: leucine-rich repeat domain-containing protein [Clostridiales bacterium]|nr:leucine-rich repeat domain-containing protein [Clostridiales bacterium]